MADPNQQYNQQAPQYPYGVPPPQGYQQYAPPNPQWGAYPNQQQPYGQYPQSVPPPMQGPPPTNYNYPPQNYPPQGYPQNQSWSQPAGYPQASPSGNYYPPPPQQFTQPPQNYGQPAPYQQPPPQMQGQPSYGAPTGFVQGVPQPPSPGFIPNQGAQGWDPTYTVESIKKACKGFNTDEKALINTITPLDPLQMESVNQRYTQGTKKQLFQLIEDKTRGSFELGLSALVKGPLMFHVWLVHRSIEGVGTKEAFLNLALLGKSNADVEAIKTAYRDQYFTGMESQIRDDLSGDTERMFNMVMAAQRMEESVPTNPAQVTADVRAFHLATEARAGTDEAEVSRILVKNNDATIRTVALEYERTYHVTLERVIDKEFSGHQKSALLFILRGALNKAKRDAELIYGTMKGIGTKDEELTFRLVVARWQPGHITNIRREFQALYGKDLVAEVRSETSGDHERLLVALLSQP